MKVLNLFFCMTSQKLVYLRLSARQETRWLNYKPVTPECATKFLQLTALLHSIPSKTSSKWKLRNITGGAEPYTFDQINISVVDAIDHETSLTFNQKRNFYYRRLITEDEIDDHDNYLDKRKPRNLFAEIMLFFLDIVADNLLFDNKGKNETIETEEFHWKFATPLYIDRYIDVNKTNLDLTHWIDFVLVCFSHKYF